MPHPNTRLALRLRAVTSNVEPHSYLELDIEDPTSNKTVATIPLHGDDLLQLLANQRVGGLEGIPAYLIEPHQRHLLGLEMINIGRRFPSYKPDSYQKQERWETALEGWAMTASVRLGIHDECQTVTYGMNQENQGRTYIWFRCYINPGHHQAFRTWGQHQLDALAGPE